MSTQTVVSSRRAVIAGALGALVGVMAQALGRPLPSRAVGEAVTVGGYFPNASAETYFDNSASNSANVLRAQTNGSGSAFFGHSSGSSGIWGQTYASDAFSAGVAGWSNSGATGVRGLAYANGTGVVGSSTNLPGAADAPGKTGVFGYAAQDSSARGVFGQSTSGRGVHGQASSGIGVRGYATTGTAGSFEAAFTSGSALVTRGRIDFGNASGTAAINAGSKSVVVTPGLDITAASRVLATLQTSAGGSTTVHRVTKDATNDRFTIHLTANATQNCTVAWLLIG